jgi:hypothetical protein
MRDDSSMTTSAPTTILRTVDKPRLRGDRRADPDTSPAAERAVAPSRVSHRGGRFLAEHHPPQRCCGTQTVMETALCKQLLNDLVGVSFSLCLARYTIRSDRGGRSLHWRDWYWPRPTGSGTRARCKRPGLAGHCLSARIATPERGTRFSSSFQFFLRGLPFHGAASRTGRGRLAVSLTALLGA